MLANGSDITQAWSQEGIWGVAKQAARQDPIIGGLIDIYQGEAEAAAVLSEKLGYDGAAETIRGVGDSLDPKFETEQGMVENITEDIGQYVPAIGAGAAVAAMTGGSGAVPIAAGVLTEASIVFKRAIVNACQVVLEA